MATKGYNSYRGRMSGGKIVLIVVLVLVLQWLTSPLSSHMLSMFEYRADENLGQHLDLSDAEYHTEDEEVAAK